jgi:DNA-binding Lrp family transcriptional regulator
MVQAYILVQTEVGLATSLAREIGAIAGVTESQDVTGPYDIIVRAEGRTLDDLTRRILNQVQQLPGITRTLTCPVVHL